jgi:hypothetical protein
MVQPLERLTYNLRVFNLITFLILYRAFSGAYHDKKDPGIYRCVVCHKELFNYKTKYNSGSGWPSFYDVIDEARVKKIVDTSDGMHRVEIICAHVSIYICQDITFKSTSHIMINNNNIYTGSQCHQTEAWCRDTGNPSLRILYNFAKIFNM